MLLLAFASQHTLLPLTDHHAQNPSHSDKSNKEFSMPLFVHAADIHLDSPLRGLVQDESSPDTEEIRGATRQSLDNLVNLVLSENAPLLLIAGDLYDGDWQDFSTGLYFVKQMQRLTANGTRVAIIRGNHDAANRMTKTLVMPENVKIFSERIPETWILDDLGIAVHGQSYPAREVSENLAITYPEPVPGFFNIGLLHCLLSGASGHLSYAPCTLDQLLAKEYNYWALGHVHQHVLVHQNPPVVYPGCSQGRHIRETGTKGCVLVYTDNDELQPEFIPLDVLRWFRLEVDISGAEKVEEATEAVGDILRETMAELDERICCARIVLTGRCPLHGRLHTEPETITANIRALAAHISHNRAWIEKIEIDTRPIIDLDELARSDTPQGELLRYLEELEAGGNMLDELNIDLSALKAKLAGTGLFLNYDNHVLHDARDILLTLLSDLEESEDTP